MKLKKTSREAIFMMRVLFVSTGNSCRSQMAEGIVNQRYKGRIEAVSAGVDPTSINPLAVKVMSEIGIDLSGHTINHPEDFRDQVFDYVITLCDSARENCPVFWTQGEATYEHMGFDNPLMFNGSEEQMLQHYRDIRDQMEEELLSFFDSELRSEEKRKAVDAPPRTEKVIK
jgi:arsenate reductase (thioredoxin)